MEELNELDNLDFFDDDYVSEADRQLENEQNVDEQEENNEPETTEPEDHEDESDILTEYLQSKGINPSSVKMTNDAGEVEEYNFHDLTREEQMQLLNYNPAEQEAPQLADDEEKLLGILRSNNMSVQDYLNAYKRHVIEQYQAENPVQQEETFDVDQYSDEELFIADLKDKVPDLTEEEALTELELQKQNESLFQKKMAGLRANYQEREKQIREYEEQQKQEQAQKQAAEFESIIVDTIQNNNSIDLGDTSLELSEDDMNEIASFILDSDPAGVRYIAKALNDPKMLVEMAWWALKGHDALNQVTQYYKKQITEARRASAPAPKPSKPKTVVTPRSKTSKPVSNDQDLFDNLI